jgi:hypothetical protein
MQPPRIGTPSRATRPLELRLLAGIAEAYSAKAQVPSRQAMMGDAYAFQGAFRGAPRGTISLPSGLDS